MKLLKTSIFSAIITFIKIASGFIASKVVAMFTGPGGVALIGAFTNFITIVLTFANGAINTGVVKYTAEYEDDELLLKKLFSTSLKISIYCSALIGFILILMPRFLSKLILHSDIYVGPVRTLGITIILYSLNSLLISILNGKKQIKTYTIVNTVGSLVGLLFTIILVYFYKISGALYALVLAQSLIFFVTAILIIKSPWFNYSFFNQKFDKKLFVRLSRYSMMAVVSAVLGPVSQIILRNMIIKDLGIDSAGYWQGMMRISDGYLLLVTTSLGTYYLPKLSSLKTDQEQKKEILLGYKLIMPLVLIGCLFIYYSRFFIIKTLYTPEFLAMEELFLWQLLGDFFKIAAYLVAYLMVAKAMFKHYIINEVIFTVVYLFLGFLLISIYGLEGITIAFFLNYFICFLALLFVFKNILWGRPSDEER